MQFPPFEILYSDTSIIAIQKPIEIHVHPTKLSKNETSCMKLLRDQVHQWVHPIHRLDRATSGVLLFAFSPTVANDLMLQFQSQTVEKTYLAVVRGYTKKSGVLDNLLREDKDKPYVEALTHFARLATIELPYAVGKFNTTRYSLVQVSPKTGRRNQIRKHFATASHHLVGDVQFGDGKHNRFFREHFNSHRLLLHAHKIAFTHPVTKETVEITAPIPNDFQHTLNQLGWEVP